MMKKAIALFLTGAMAFSLAACGSSDSTSVETTEQATTETTTEATSAAETLAETVAASASGDYSDIKIGMVTDVGGVNDGSFNESSWEGLQQAGEDLGCTVQYLESKTDADYTPNIENFMDDDYDLIICVGYQLADALNEAATENPDQKFAIIDDSSNSDLPNVTCLMFKQAQASYLVGYVAGLTTETNTVGFVLGMSTDTMNQFGYGYCAGVLDANPDATILQQNANSYADTATGKSAATTMVTNGADVIFHAAGGTGLGVIDGCQEAGIWAIGVDTDQSSIAPDTVLTSAMKRVDNACYDVATQLCEGTLESGVITYDLAAGGVGIAPTTDNISADVLTKVQDVEQQIIDGTIVVPETKDDFEAKYGDVYELDED